MNGLIKTMTRGLYDLQKLRIQMGNRVVGNFKVKLGIQPGEKETLAEKDAEKILKVLHTAYEKITDGVTEITRRQSFDYDGVISDYGELVLMHTYRQIECREKEGFRQLNALLKHEPLWTAFLVDVKGVGPAMAGVIISEIDITKAKYPSSLWKYAGLDVVKGEGRSRKKHHLVEQEYEDTNGEIQTKKGISFNPFLKTKLIGVLGSSFLRAQDDYAEIYYNYRNRIDHMEKHAGKSDGHRHNMAIRYMVKMFLKDLHIAWRELEGLPVSATYQEKKLQHVHE